MVPLPCQPAGRFPTDSHSNAREDPPLAAAGGHRAVPARRKYSGTKQGVDRWRSEAYNRPVTTTLFQVDDDARLFISPVIEDWAIAAAHEINVVIDLEGGLDQCIPTMPGSCLYVYFPIFDEELPDSARLDAVTMMGAHLVRTGHRVLSHCGMGFNRSALIAGRILHQLGMAGPDVVSRLRERRPGALFNDNFAEYLSSLPPIVSAASETTANPSL
jgi:hypothetical protein